MKKYISPRIKFKAHVDEEIADVTISASDDGDVGEENDSWEEW